MIQSPEGATCFFADWHRDHLFKSMYFRPRSGSNSFLLSQDVPPAPSLRSPVFHLFAPNQRFLTAEIIEVI
ncbi:MAG TPA: hypothetical protein DCY95_05700 [Algoriphagus sp.]|nr:hypothetical protein [Algoriphagus sp.]MAN86135.1 hypothetical protein [Algoriphagus sp.]HAD51158.1 hypothetical protein [Algoriphagus sp.]HAS58066.1 hypothetical protein [Algoriphagus sp.]HAZ24193.1 hypothetical protein [Algoriphagus sp.]